MEDYQFRINLLHDGNTYQSPSEVLRIANTKTIYLPLYLGSLPMKPLKHGDTFTVSGQMGRNLKRLVESGRILHEKRNTF